MFFKLLSNKPLPWEGVQYKNKKTKDIIFYYMKKDCDFESYYKEEDIVMRIVKSYHHFIYNEVISFDYL